MKKPAVAVTGALAALALLTACSTSAQETETDTAAGSAPATSSAPSSSETASASADSTSSSTPITITADGRTITATLNDSDVSQDFIETLPRTLTWDRNIGIEYITELSAPMTETGPFYTDVQAGDIVYYNPMDSITIIYAPTSSVPTLTKMGEITSDLGDFESLPDSVEMRIELG